MDVEFTGPVIEWRGPAPYYFVTVPQDQAEMIQDVAAAVTYGWGMIPVTVTIGDTEWYTALWPRQGQYVVPLKDWVRKDELIGLDDVVSVRLSIAV